MAISVSCPWRLLDEGDEHDAFQRRYDIEVAGAHPLARSSGMIVARSDANDDVLVETSDGRFAIVHLTWSDSGLGYPRFALYETDEAVSRFIKDEIDRS
ncbi:hypothetical protein [Labrys wisconsinensis]|uniref:Uncharacterized protein n=1 Tax=Labrys wisconsinensis TaxID=425677 RepID=A0ABU0J975_9HYPH|nr:hypothetical protein [Labrys wisconsinensis]MDQ0470831.1 hypothetical protein [Labrys wisconsinensis]